MRGRRRSYGWIVDTLDNHCLQITADSFANQNALPYPNAPSAFMMSVAEDVSIYVASMCK